MKMLLSLLLAAGLAGCGAGPAGGEDVVVAEGSLADGPRPTGQPLYQLLYAGEHGDAAFASGQHARARGWLSGLSPSPEQLEGLRRLARVRSQLEREAADERALLDSRERVLLPPVYDDIAALYSRPAPPSSAELASLAVRLESARAEVEKGIDPARAQYTRVTRLFVVAQETASLFPEDQRPALAAARFLLGRSVHPLSTPGGEVASLGSTWDAMDFAALKVDPRDDEEGEMDVGGLFAAERLGQAGSSVLVENQLASILMVASGTPGFSDAIGASTSGHPADPAVPGGLGGGPSMEPLGSDPTTPSAGG
ncbi:MAG: hypothetical protein VX000_05600 [Myxococcota bacterium]|nr:hypothetical protein [Myxococcota bacterium]